mmetsp:Transcript_75/g.218  ORF Transcript_75/g.218 Transcript_75/m.218 type:complete len:400 (+) Transcript_75:714-1913(+)
MGHGEQRPRGESALDLLFHLVGEGFDGLRRDVLVGHFVQRLLKVGDSYHSPQPKHFVRMGGLQVLLHEVPGQWLPIARNGIFGTPRRVSHQRIQKHALQLCVCDGSWGSFLRKQRRGHGNIREMRGMSRLVHQGGQARHARSHSGGIGEARKMRRRGLQGPVRPHPGRLGPVAEPVRVLPLPVQQVQVHRGAAVDNVHRGERPAPLFDRLLERKIFVHLARDVPGHQKAAVPRRQGFRPPLLVGEPCSRRLHDGPRPLLQPVEDDKELVLPESLRLGDLVIVVVLISEGLGHGVPRPHEFHEPILHDEVANFGQPVVAGPPNHPVGIDPQPRPEPDARHLLEPPADRRAEDELVPLALQMSFDGGRRGAEFPGLLGFHDVALEGPLEHPQCDDRRIVLR